MLTRLRFQTLNCQAQTVSSFAYLRVCEKEFYAAFSIGSLVGLEIDVLISFGFFIYNRDKFIRLTVFYYKRTATQIIIFTVVVQNRRIIGFDNFFSKKFRSSCLLSYINVSLCAQRQPRFIGDNSVLSLFNLSQACLHRFFKANAMFERFYCDRLRFV